MLAAAILLVIVFMFLGAPIFVILAALAFIGFYFMDTSPMAVANEVFRLADNPVLISIPLFTFAGFLLGESKTPQRLVKVSRAILGWMPGGLALVSIAACAFFTAFNGASGVTIITLGGILFPALVADQYREKFSLGIITAGGCLGLLFAPSIPLILYGIIAEQPITDMFIAGILPCFLMLIILAGYSFYEAFRNKIPRTSVTFAYLFEAVKEAKWELGIPVIVFGGIYGGFLAVSEMAAFTAFYVLMIEVFIYREISLKKLVDVMRQSMIMVGGILIILSCALASSNYFITAELPTKLFHLINAHVHSKITFLIMLNLFVLVLGMLIDIFSAIVIVVPLLIPVAELYGINLVHLGIIFLANMEIGYLTPPVGLNLFIASYRFKRSVLEIAAASLPYIGLLLIALIIITYWPDLSLFLLRLMGRPY